MGINRVSVKCDICDDQFALRVTVAGDKQHHLFNCPNCDSFLEYSYQINDLLKKDIIENYSNCKQLPDIVYDKVINLHPDFPIPKKELNNPKFSTNIYMLDLAGEHVEDHDELEGIVDGHAVREYWKDIKISWDLFDNLKFDILKKRIPEYDTSVEIEHQFYNLLYNFTSSIHLEKSLTPWNKSYFDLCKDLSENHNPEFIRFLVYYCKNIFKANLAFYKHAFQDFFNAYDDVKQVRLLAKLGISTSDHVISMVNFNNSKKMYGDFFEILDKTFISLPLMQKIATQGAFDNFSNYTLDGFLRSSITNKVQSLSGNPKFTVPNPDITNNRIRNASHHNTIYFDKKTQKVKCVDRDHSFELDYLDYLMKCTQLSNYLIGLMSIDLELYSLWSASKSN